VKKSEENTDGLDEKALEEEVKCTRSLLNTFLQTVKAYRLYESNHPMLSKFLDRMKRDFSQYFEEFDSFSLQVREHQLFHHGEVVYESQDVRENLAFAFYKDGIREIRFYKGLEDREVFDFLNIVRKSDQVNRSEDDLVTLLWERDFSHIDFITVDEFLEGSGTLVPVTGEDLSKKLEYRGNWEEGWVGKEDPAEKERQSSIAVEGLKQVFSLSPGQSLVQACLLSPEEQEEIDRMAHQELQPEYLYVLIDNLIEILLHLGEDIDAYENMIAFFQRTIESLLDQGDVKQAVKMLSNLSQAIESMVLKDKQIFAIRRILESSSSPQAVERLGKVLKDNGEKDPDSIQQYFQTLTKQAIDPLCLMLGQLESGKWRRMICDRLAELCQADIQPLVKYLSDPNLFVVHHILYVLGKVGQPSVLKYLGPLSNHEDLKVREETLKLITKFEEKGKDLLQRFLRDSHPEIRGKASLALAKAAKGQAVKPLSDIILSEDFFKRSYEEKASFFKALGETRSQAAVPLLQEIARKRRWLQKAKWDEMRQCAAMALKMMGVS
jgi:tetratricopeptide (TPR) repeat protein